jgi:hypothetical protein
MQSERIVRTRALTSSIRPVFDPSLGRKLGPNGTHGRGQLSPYSTSGCLVSLELGAVIFNLLGKQNSMNRLIGYRRNLRMCFGKGIDQVQAFG